MLLGFYDRTGNGLAVELSPEMAKAIASRAREIFAAIQAHDCFSSTVEVRLSELALEEVFQMQDGEVPAKEPDGFFHPLESFVFAASGRALWSTGVWLDVQQYRAIGGEPTIFWEFYGSNYERQCTPSLSLSQLDAIAQNQPLPQGNE